jgi:hypothetical protein
MVMFIEQQRLLARMDSFQPCASDCPCAEWPLSGVLYDRSQSAGGMGSEGWGQAFHLTLAPPLLTYGEPRGSVTENLLPID